MRKSFFITLLIALLLTACSQATVETTPTTDVNAIYTEVAMTLFAEASQQQNQTPTQEPTLPPPPTETPTPQDTQSQDIFSWNYLAEQTSSGITVQIARVIIANKESMEKELDLDFDQNSIFQDKPIVVEVIFKITNNTEEIITIHPYQSTVVVNTEQIDLFNYAMSGTIFGDNINGDVYPGATVIGGIWIALKRTPLEEISKMTIGIDAPTLKDDWNPLGEDYFFELPLTDRKFEPMPEELK